MASIGQKYMSRTEARRALGLTRDQMIYRIRRGDIKAEKAGYNYLIPVTELERVPAQEWYKATQFRPEAAQQ